MDIATMDILGQDAMSFLEFLKIFHPFQATDPRDKIYSLFGLSRNNQAANILVDYKCSVEQLYTTGATQILSSSSCLHFYTATLDEKASTCHPGSPIGLHDKLQAKEQQWNSHIWPADLPSLSFE
jgi:hypothetical protein